MFHLIKEVFELDKRYTLDFRDIYDAQTQEKYTFDSFIDAEKVFHILCYYELKLKIKEAQVRELQYKADLNETKLNLIDDIIIQQIAEYTDNSYTPAGTSQTKNAYNKISALTKLKEQLPLEDIKTRNKMNSLLKLRAELGLMSGEEMEELKNTEFKKE